MTLVDVENAALALLVSEGFVRNGVRYGGYARDDPAKFAVEATAREAMGAYYEAWGALAQAEQDVKQVRASQERAAQEAWVETYAPAVVAEYQSSQRALASAEGERARYIAKDRYSRALFAYNSAMLNAPVSTNGHRPH